MRVARSRWAHDRAAEVLESRVLLSATLNAIDRQLQIEGTAQADLVIVDLPDDVLLRVVVNEELHTFNQSDVDAIVFRGRSGNDHFTNATAIRAIAFGGSGADTLRGGTSRDVLVGQQGNDVLFGGNGLDRLRGGSGNDRLDGGNGNDRLFGQGGDDTLSGRSGSDRLSGASGFDTVIESANVNLTLTRYRLTGLGNDRLVRIERAHLTGGSGDNLIDAARFNGTVTLHGGGGDDTLQGTQGADYLRGGDGHDLLMGNAGDDIIEGRDGDDTIYGGDGRDSLNGAEGDDQINGDAGNDTLDGLAGNDRLDGGADSDILLGRGDDDQLDGGPGRDLLFGGLGSDSVSGGDDADIVIGATVLYEGDFETLDMILASWTSNDIYGSRIAAIESPGFAGFLDAPSQFSRQNSVYDDFRVDTLSGGNGEDWFILPSEPSLATQDAVIDRDLSERVNMPDFGDRAPAFSPITLSRPDYLQTIVDPTLGATITRVTGDPGTVFTTLQIQVGDTPVITTADMYWGGVVRNRYLTDSAWNVDGTLLQLRSFDAALGYQVLLDGNSANTDTYLNPLAIVDVPTTSLRWSQDPARPTLQYGFLTHQVVEYDVLTGQITRRIPLPFTSLTNTSKTSIAFVGGQQYVALLGTISSPSSTNEPDLFIVNLDAPTGSSPVVARFSLSDASHGLGAFATGVNPLSLRYSPNGEFALIAYPLANGSRTWRLLDVDLAAGVVSPHVLPSLGRQSFYAMGDANRGFFAVNWGHPVFAYASDGQQVHVVGGAGSFAGERVSQIQTFNNNASEVGSILSYNTTTNTYRSLNGWTGSTLSIEHVGATNYSNPGYVFGTVLPGTRPSGDYIGQIVAFNLDDPESSGGAVSIAYHRTNAANGCSNCQPLPVLTPDGSQLLFSSTWGNNQGVVSSFIVDLNLPTASGGV